MMRHDELANISISVTGKQKLVRIFIQCCNVALSGMEAIHHPSRENVMNYMRRDNNPEIRATVARDGNDLQRDVLAHDKHPLVRGQVAFLATAAISKC